MTDDTLIKELDEAVEYLVTADDVSSRSAARREFKRARQAIIARIQALGEPTDAMGSAADRAYIHSLSRKGEPLEAMKAAIRAAVLAGSVPKAEP